MSQIKQKLGNGGKRLKKAFGFGTVDPVEDLKEKRETFARLYTMADERLMKVEGMPTMQHYPPAKTALTTGRNLLNDAQSKAGLATTAEAVQEQSKRLTEVYTHANDAIAAAKPAKNLKEFEKAWGSAREKLGEMRKLPGADTTTVSTHVTTASELVKTTATKARALGAASTAVQTEITNLKGISDLETKAKEASKLFLQGKPKNYIDFESARTKALDKLADVRKLRTDQAFLSKLKEAEDIITNATTAARKATKEPEVFTEITNLGGVDEKIKEAKGLSTTAKKTSKTSRQNVQELQKWNQLLSEAERARETVLGIPVAAAEYKLLSDLIKKAEMTFTSKGAVEATKELSGYTTHLKRAEEKKNKAQDVVIPQAVQTEVDKVLLQIQNHDKLSTEFAVADYKEDVERARFLGVTDQPGALQKLQEISKTVGTDLTLRQNEQKSAQANLLALETALDQFAKDGFAPALAEPVKYVLDSVKSQDIAGYDWAHADLRLVEAIARLGKIADEHRAAKVEWEKGDAERKQLRELVNKLALWPPLAQEAVIVRERLNEVENQLKTSNDYVASQKAYLDGEFGELKAELERLQTLETNFPDDVQKLRTLQEDLAKAWKNFNEAETTAQKPLKALADALPEIKYPDQTEHHKALAAIRAQWEKAVAASPLDPLATVGPFVQQMKDLGTKVEKLTKTPSELQKFKTTAEKGDKAHEESQLPSTVQGLLQECADLGFDVDAERNQVATLTDEKKTDAQSRASGLRLLEKILQDRIADEKKTRAENVKRTKGNIERGIKSPLFRIKGRHSKFQDYQEELETQANDLMSLANSDDPYLQGLVTDESQALLSKIKEVDPEQRGEGATRYKEVEAAWEELAHVLADNEMEKYLPETHANLKAELARMIGETRKASPASGLDLLKDLRTRMKQANQSVIGVKAEVKLYKARRERLEKQWAQIKKETRTRVTDRATEFAGYLDARLEEADQARKQENGVRVANAILQNLETLMQRIETSPDPRAELQKVEGETAQGQREIRDLARKFQDDLKFFTDETLPTAKKVIKEKDGDKTLLTSLKATAKNVVKPVQPYLDLLTVTKIGAAKSPDLSKAKQDFQTASNMLASATRMAKTLQDGGVSSTIDVTKDLAKVREFYVRQARAYTAAAQKVADAIVAASVNGTDDEKTQAGKAAKLIEKAAGDFRPNAFNLAFAKLEEPPTPGGGMDGARLAAREKALKTMRAYRKLVKDHPVHLVLSQPHNPFDSSSTMRAAARALRIALKRVELEALVGA